MDLIQELYEARDEMLRAQCYEAFIETWQGGKNRDHTWIKHYYDSYIQHPELFFDKPLIAPLAKKLDQIFGSWFVQYTKLGMVPVSLNTAQFIDDSKTNTFNVRQVEYHTAAVYGVLSPDIAQKRVAMWGAKTEELSWIELLPIGDPHQRLMLVCGRPRNITGRELIAVVELEKIDL